MSSTTNPSTQHTSTIGAIGAPSRRNTELALLVTHAEIRLQPRVAQVVGDEVRLARQAIGDVAAADLGQ